MNVRTVKLLGGPSDGLYSVASHDTAWMGGECYVWNGHEDRATFIHAKTTLTALPQDQFNHERERVHEYMHAKGAEITVGSTKMNLPPPLSMLIGIPPWRINAWMQLLKTESL